MVKKYRVVFLGLVKSKERFIRGMSGVGVSSSRTEEIIHKAPVILKGDMTLGPARQYADAIHDAGGRVNIQDDGISEDQKRTERSVDIKPFHSFIMCPECGYKQLKVDVCVKCGNVYGTG